MIAFIKAKIWSGAGWLLTLCVILVSVIIIYFLLHRHYTGTDHKKLDPNQLANIDNLLAAFPDTVPQKLKNDSTGKRGAYILVQREKRDKLIYAFLINEYDNSIDTSRFK